MDIVIFKFILNIIKKPFILFGIYAALIPFDYILGIGESGTLTKYLAIILIFTIPMNIISFKRGFFLKIPNVSFYLMSFIFWAFLSIWWSFDKEIAIHGFITIFGLYILYLIIAIYPINIERLIFIKTMIIVGGTICSLITLYLFYNGIRIDGFTRATIIIGNRYIDPNHLSVCLIIPFFLVIEKYLTQRKFKIFNIIIFLIIILTIIFAASRTAIIAIISASIFLLFKLNKKYKKRVFLIFIVGIMFLSLFSTSNLKLRFERDIIMDDINRGRLSILKVGIKSFIEKPIFGWGYSNFQITHYTISKRFPKLSSREPLYFYPHNIYLRVLVELGIIGIIIFLLSLYKHWRLLKLLENNSKISISILEAIFLGMLISGLFLGISYLKYFWLVFSLIMMEKNINYKNIN